MQKNLQSLDLSNTHLSAEDINKFVLEIVKRDIKMTSLNLSYCNEVNDDVINDLCCLFSKNSTIKELRLDKTDITEKGLAVLFESIKESLKVHTISVVGCKLELKLKKTTGAKIA